MDCSGHLMHEAVVFPDLEALTGPAMPLGNIAELAEQYRLAHAAQTREHLAPVGSPRR